MKRINKIVQTLWTKPIYDDPNVDVQNRFNGGWNSKKYYFMNWALSCLQLRKFYNDVELLTDERGKHLLIDCLNLPYTNVRVELDCLNHYHTMLWTLPKIYSYKIQNEPFIHADGDVIIWERFNDNIETAQLCSQQLVMDHKPQYFVLDEIFDNFNYIPECIKKDKDENTTLCISNAGILGGTNLDFFKEYVDQSFEFVDKNLSNLYKLKSGIFGMIFEEYLFYCLAKEKGIDITYLLEPIGDDFQGTKLVDFESVPYKVKYIHPVGAYKRNPDIAESLSNTLLRFYPEWYYGILELLHDFVI